MKKFFATFVIIVSAFFINACEEINQPEDLPEIVISSPTDGAIVSGIVTIKVVVSSNVGMGKVEFYVNGDLIGTDYDEPYQYQWNTQEYEYGNYTIVCKAIDKEGNEKLSEQINVKLSVLLLKLNVINNWLENRSRSMLFISDSLGIVLAETTISEDGEYLIYSENKNLSNLKEMSVSFTEDLHYNSIITTYMNIPVGSEWIFRGREKPNSRYQISLNFTNVPTYEHYILSTKWNNSYGTSGIPYTFTFPESPSDLYLRLVTLNGVKYTWIENITDGQTLTNDLSAMNETQEKTITGFDPDNIGLQLYFEGLYDEYYAMQLLDQSWTYNNSSTVKLHFPSGKFNNYATSLAETHGDGRLSYYYITHRGNIPDEFEKMNAGFDFVSEDYDNFKITTSGDFVKLRTIWTVNNGTWYVFSNKNTTEYALPDLPSSIENYYNISPSQGFLYKTTIEDFDNIKTYQDYIHILFESAGYIYNYANNYYNITKYYSAKGNAISGSIKKEIERERLW